MGAAGGAGANDDDGRSIRNSGSRDGRGAGKTPPHDPHRPGREVPPADALQDGAVSSDVSYRSSRGVDRPEEGR